MKKYFLSVLISLVSLQNMAVAQAIPIIPANSYWEKVLPAFDTLAARLEYAHITQLSKTERIDLVRRLYSLSEKHKELPILYARALYFDARLRTNGDSTIFLLKKCMRLIPEEKRYEYDRFCCRYLQAKIWVDKGNWLPSYIEAKELKAYFAAKGDLFMLGNAYVLLGIILTNLRDTYKGVKYLQKADSCFREVKDVSCQIKNKLNVYNVLYSQNRGKNYIDSLKSLLTYRESKRDTSFYINVLLSVYSYDTIPAEKQEYAFQAYDMARCYTDKLLLEKTTINKALVFYDKAMPDSACFYYRQALEYSRKNKNFELLLLSLSGMRDTWASLGRWDSAYFYSSRYNYYNDSLSNLSNILEINRIEGKEAIKRYEDGLVQAKIKAQLQRRVYIWISAAVFSILFCICLLLWYLGKKERIGKQLKEMELKEVNLQLEKEMLQNERFHFEMDLKNRELTSNAIMAQEKNEVLRELLKQIEDLGSEGELPRKKSAELKKQIKGHLQTDDEWKYFKLHFEGVHPDFFQNLKKHYSSLSENELRLCAYIRIGMSNKQIAQMLSVKPDSIKISRHRVRRKFSLQQEASLEDFLRAI